MGATIVRHEVIPEPVFDGEHNVWFIRLNGRVFFVSHQSKLGRLGPECIACPAAEIDGELVVPRRLEVLAVSHSSDPLDALADVVEQLEGRGK